MAEKAGKPIRFTRHALESMARRGTFRDEVAEAIQRAAWTPARSGRFECALDFPYNGIWNGKRYATKQVAPVFIKEEDAIVVITAYVFYF